MIQEAISVIQEAVSRNCLLTDSFFCLRFFWLIGASMVLSNDPEPFRSVKLTKIHIEVASCGNQESCLNWPEGTFAKMPSD